jgi:hypothetical protein
MEDRAAESPPYILVLRCAQTTPGFDGRFDGKAAFGQLRSVRSDFLFSSSIEMPDISKNSQ